MSKLFVFEDGAYSITDLGIEIGFILIIVLLGFLFFINKSKKNDESKKTSISTMQVVFSAAALALAFVTSYIKLLPMPWGGSITLFSMLFVVLIGYWYGPTVGIIAGFAYGILQFMQDGGSYILSPLQVMLDYIFAFAALGVSGFFKNKKNGLLIGYIVAILFRGVFHSIGGYIYWMEYMPDNFPKSLSAIYPICYNYAYILGEGILTVILLFIPAVKDSLKRVKVMALGGSSAE